MNGDRNIHKHAKQIGWLLIVLHLYSKAITQTMLAENKQ